MIEAEGVSYLLAHYVLALVGIIVSGRIEIGVVHLCRTLRNMGAASQIDRCQPQPTIASIGAVADLRSTSDHGATLVGRAGNDCSQDRAVARIPVTRRCRHMRFPVRRCQVIAQLQRELRSRPCPMIATPRMGRQSDSGDRS